MKTFVYPAVLFEDKKTNSFVIAVYDLALYAEGNTVEEAHEQMKDMMGSFFSVALKNDLDFNPPTDFNKIMADFPKNLCILVEVNLDNKNNPM